MKARLAGLFRPLGQGDTPVAETIAVLEASGYDGWYVLEQDTDIGADDAGARHRADRERTREPRLPPLAHPGRVT